MLKRKKNEGVMAYFKRWSERGFDVASSPPPGCEPLIISSSLYQKINERKMNYEETILSFGFYPSGSCDCGGVRNEKYRNGQYVIYIRKTKNQFKIKRKNEVIVPLKSLNELEKELNELFIKTNEVENVG